MTPIVGQQVRLRPGLRDKPYSAATGRVVELVNDRFKIRIGVLEYLVSKEEIMQ